jgi:hypothetical protein
MNKRSKRPKTLSLSPGRLFSDLRDFFYGGLIQSWSENRFNILLFLLLTIFLGRPLWQVVKVGAIFYTTFILLILLILISSPLFSRRGRWFFLCLAGLAFLTQIQGFLLPKSLQFQDSTPLVITGLLINSVFLGSSAYLIVKTLFLQTKCTGDTIKGGICAYLLIGIFWATLYQVLNLLNPDAFQVTCEECSLDLFYFSFTTLTTLGYGEILPVNIWARSLANLEAIVGLMYPAIYIARLVSLYDRAGD